MRIDDILAAFEQHLRSAELERADDTVTAYLACLRLAHRQLPAGLIESCHDELVRWLRRDHLSNATRCQYTTIIRVFYAWATDPKDPWLSLNPAERIRTPRRHRKPAPPAVSDDEMAQLLTRAVGRYRLWVLLAAYAGLRCCEISALDRQHITAERIMVFGKGSKWRIVPTDPEIWAAVQHLPAGPIAVGRDGKRLDRQAVSTAARAHFTLTLDLPGVSMHRLRKWCGKTVQRRHRDIRVTQQILGHASPVTTMRYTDVDEGSMVAALATLPRVAELVSGEANAAAAHHPRVA